jgi:hypothetical protein
MMAAMHATHVDPRSTGREIDQPAYRVYFWRPTSNDPRAGWASDEWRLTEADVHEVLAWAEEQANGRRITSWVEIPGDGEPRLIRLSGWEPTRSDSPAPWVRR